MPGDSVAGAVAIGAAVIGGGAGGGPSRGTCVGFTRDASFVGAGTCRFDAFATLLWCDFFFLECFATFVCFADFAATWCSFTWRCFLTELSRFEELWTACDG